MTKPNHKVRILVLHEVEKKDVEMGVRYLIRSGTHWWVGDFYLSNELTKNAKELVSELSGLSVVPLRQVDRIYALP